MPLSSLATISVGQVAGSTIVTGMVDAFRVTLLSAARGLGLGRRRALCPMRPAGQRREENPMRGILWGGVIVAHYDQHPWFRDSPNGNLEPFNPTVTCRHHKA